MMEHPPLKNWPLVCFSKLGFGAIFGMIFGAIFFFIELGP